MKFGFALALACLGALSSGCARSRPHVASPLDSIPISKAAPVAGATPLRELRAVDGHGCGLSGTLGTYDGAARALRMQANAIGADYVQLTGVKEPYADRKCAHKEYVLSGTAYRVAKAPPAAAGSPQATTALPPATPLVSKIQRPGLALAESGCGFRGEGASRSLDFSARLAGEHFTVLIDEPAGAAASVGFALRFARTSRRLELVRRPGETVVSIAPEPFELDRAFHAWRVTRTPSQIDVLLDDRRVLSYLAPAPTAPGSFRLDGDQLEVRSITLGETREATPQQ